MSENKDPVTEFGRSRREDDLRRKSSSMNASSIDDMLDALDRVLSSEVTLENDYAQDPAPIVECVQSILAELEEVSARLLLVAVNEGDELVQSFVKSLQSRIVQLKRRAEDVPGVAAGPIEIELDYASLHEFMLFPDLDRLAG